VSRIEAEKIGAITVMKQKLSGFPWFSAQWVR
jgi:hypothetical protein